VPTASTRSPPGTGLGSNAAQPEQAGERSSAWDMARTVDQYTLLPMSGRCAFVCLRAGLHIANGGSNLQFTFVVRTGDEPNANSARVTQVVPTWSGFAHMDRFCWHRRALQPATSESPGSGSRTASWLRGYRVTALELTVRTNERPGNGRICCPLAAAALRGGRLATGRRPLARRR
jgi:hypothetical protein